MAFFIQKGVHNMEKTKWYDEFSQEAKEAKLKYYRDYSRKRYATDEDYRKRRLESQKRFWERKALEKAQLLENAQSKD